MFVYPDVHLGFTVNPPAIGSFAPKWGIPPEPDAPRLYPVPEHVF